MALDGAAGSEPEMHVCVFLFWQPIGKVVEFEATGLPEQDAPAKNEMEYDDAEMHDVWIENVPELLTNETQPPASGADGGCIPGQYSESGEQTVTVCAHHR